MTDSKEDIERARHNGTTDALLEGIRDDIVEIKQSLSSIQGQFSLMGRQCTLHSEAISSSRAKISALFWVFGVFLGICAGAIGWLGSLVISHISVR